MPDFDIFNWFSDDLSSEKDFNTAFKKAREKGSSDFVYKGKKYNTNVKPPVDLSDAPDFNTAFKSAKEGNHKEFNFKGKKYSTKLIDPKSELDFKNSKNFLSEYINTLPDGVKSKARQAFDTPGYFSITDQKGNTPEDGYYNSETNKLFVTNSNPTNFVHELTHKSGITVDGGDEDNIVSLINKYPSKRINKELSPDNLDYLLDPSERAARHIATRYYLKQQGLPYDKITSKEYNFLKSRSDNAYDEFLASFREGMGFEDANKIIKERGVPYDIQQLLELYPTEEEFVKQLNKTLNYSKPQSKQLKQKEDEDELDMYINQFYQKYAPKDVPYGDRRKRLKEKLAADFEGYTAQMYQKYAPDSTPDGPRMDSLKTKYLKPVVSTPQPQTAGVGEYASSGVNALDRGIMQVISSPLKLEGQLEQSLGVKNPIQGGLEALGVIDEGEPWLLRAGNAIDQWSEETYPSNPNVNPTFQSAAQGIGQGAAMIATAGTSAASGLAAQTAIKVPGLVQATGSALKEIGKYAGSTPGMVGGAMVATPEWQAAKDAGMSDEDAFGVLVKNYFIGLSEGVPIVDALSRLNKATGGKLLEKVKISGISSLEEFIQEAFQTYATNKVAQGSYDPERDPLYQVLESAKVGGIVGLIIPSIGSTVTGKKTPAKIEEKLAPIKAAEDAKPDTEIAPEVEAKVKEVITAINDTQDNQGISSAIGEGQEPIQEDTNKVPSPETVETSGNVQETREEVVPLNERENLEGFITGHGEEAVSQIAEFAEGRFNKRSEFESFVEAHNEKNERKITDAEANAVWDQIREKKPRDKDTSKKVKMTEVQGLKKQIQDFARGVKEGRLDAKKDINELSTKIGETLGKANITPTQSKSIINRIGKVNLLNPKKVNELLRYTSKVASDADYADKLNEAESLQSKLKAASNSKETFASFKPALKKLANVKPENVDLDQYIKQANQYLNSRKDVKGKAYNPANLAEFAKFADDAEVANKLAIDAQAREDIGGEDTDLSKEDIDYIYSDSDDYYENASQTKQVEIKDKLRQVADYSMMGLEDKSTPIAETIKSLPLERLEPNQLKQFIRVADNIALNDDYSGAGGLESLGKAIQGADELVDSPAARELGTIASSAYNLSNILKSMYGLSKQAAKVRQATGIGGFYAGTSKAKTQSDDFKNGYVKLADSMKGDPFTKDRIMRRGIAAYLHGYDQGSDPTASFQRAKENMEESISREKNPEAAQAIYNDFKNANSIEEVKSILQNKFPDDWKLMEYTKKHFSEIKEKQQESNKTYDNRYAPVVEDYFPRDFVSSDVKIEKDNRYDSIRPFSPSTSFSRNNQLPRNSTINLAFEQVMFDKYQDTLMDMYANPYVMQFKLFADMPEATKIFGSKENLNKFKGVIQTGINKEMGSYGYRESELARAFDNVAQILKNAAYVRALGSPTQFLKQSTVLINSVIRLGNPTYLAGTPTNAKIYDSFSIGQRSKRVAGLYAEDVMDNTFKLNYANKVAEALFKTKVGLEKHVWNRVSSFVRVPDVYSAKKTWGAFFKKYFKEQYGEDVDLTDAHYHLDDPRYQQAAQYAEQIVSETQGHSASGEAPQFLTPKSTGARFALGVFLPFSTYAFNTKARIINISKYMATGNKAQRLEAASSMVGLMSEVAAFNAIGYILATGMLGLPSYNSIFDSMWRSMFGFDEPDKDEEKQDIFRQQVIMSNAFKDLMPITVEQNSTDYLLNYLNELSTNGLREESYTQEEIAERKPFYVRKQDKGPLDGSIYSIPLKEIMGDGYEVNYEDNILTIQTQNGPKDIPIDDNLESYLLMSSVLEALAMAGIGLSDINNSMERVKKEQIKQAKRNASNE